MAKESISYRCIDCHSDGVPDSADAEDVEYFRHTRRIRDGSDCSPVGSYSDVDVGDNRACHLIHDWNTEKSWKKMLLDFVSIF